MKSFCSNLYLVTLEAALLVTLLLVGLSPAESIRSDILQQKNGRLYFSSGENELIFPGHKFAIYCGADSIYSGIIEFSHQDISYSNLLTLDSTVLLNCEAVIETASIDSSSTIIIGCLKNIAALALLNFDTTDSKFIGSSDSLQPSRHSVRIYDSSLDMELDLELGKIDAAISYFPIKTKTLRSTEAIPAPFIAAIWPNVSSKVNQGALLTTSMIYRYDDNNPGRYFRGEGINHLTSLSPLPGRFFSKRYYPYDPKKGANLARLVRKKSKTVNLLVPNPELNTLADYFADVLSRDRLKTTIVEKVAQADVVIGMVPFRSDDPLQTMTALIKNLTQMPNPPRNAREQIKLAADNITSASKETDLQKVEYFANLARYRLIEDLGVFPLFRPSIFFISGRQIRGMDYDTNGKIDLTGLIRIIPPGKPEASQ